LNETSYDTIFGKMAIEQRFCTDAEMRKALEKLRANSKEQPTTLQDVMVKLGYITTAQAERLKGSIKETKTSAHQIPGYQILGKLGAGAMAVVYKARQLSLDRVVAVKVLPKRFSESEDYVERFYREGQAAAKLNHNNIVQAIDVGEAGGYHYFVMEYVKGKTIYDDLSTGKVFSEAEALDMTIQVASALAHAHAQGLIHRDVKPKNIIINEKGVVKLADMGLAREMTDIKSAEAEAGKAYGTPYYIAPEQIRGQVDIDGRADIYSLGATLYHMVTGKVPFEASDPTNVMRKHLKEPLIPPDHINTSLSAGISEVIEVMMAKKKAVRYGSVNELLIDLQAVKDGQPPLQARKRFNVAALKQLQNGLTVEEPTEEKMYSEEIVTRYKIAVLILGTLCVVSLVLLLFLINALARG